MHAFLGQYGVGKDGLGFLEQEAFVINAGAVVANAKAGNLGGLGKACCLRGGGVGVLACTWFHLMWIGGLMIEQRDILEHWSQRWGEECVGAISEAARGVGRSGEFFVWKEGAVGCGPSASVLDVVDLAEGNLEGINHVASDVRQQGLFTKQIATAGHSVAQGERPYFQAAVLVYQLMGGGVDGMEQQSVAQVFAVVPFYQFQQGPYLFGGMDVEVGGASHQCHGAYESGKAEYMVAMVVADEHVAQPVHAEPAACEGHLGAFSAVDHEQLASAVQYLAGWVVLVCGTGRTASQDVKSEWFHACWGM